MFAVLETRFQEFSNDIFLEYTTYLGASTISLSFWLNWFLDMISETNVTKGQGFESPPPLN